MLCVAILPCHLSLAPTSDSRRNIVSIVGNSLRLLKEPVKCAVAALFDVLDVLDVNLRLLVC